MAFNDNTHTSTTGAHGTNVGADHKPTVGEKISGTMDKITGKITNNPAKVAEGEAKKRGDTVAAEQADHAANAHKSIGNNAGTGHGTHTGTGAYEGSGHHTGAATGAGLGATGAGVGSGLGHDHSHSHTGTHTGTGTGTGTGLGHKAPGEPTMGDKVAGNTQAAAGRMTNDPVQYAQGQERKTDTSYGAGATGAGLGSGMGHTGPTGTGTGTGLTGSHGAHNTGTGLTGSHDAHNTGTGLTGSHGTHSTGAGLTGSHNTHGTGYDNHNLNNHNNNATMGEKLSGGMDKMVGKATNDPVRVAEGEAKSQGHNIPNQHSATGGIGGHNAGQTYTGAPGTNTGAPY